MGGPQGPVNPTGHIPSTLERLQQSFTGAGEYDPDIGEAPPPPPANASLASKLLMAGSRFASSDPDELAAMYKHQWGGVPGKDRFGATTVTMPETGYQFHPNRPGASVADVVGGVANYVPDVLTTLAGPQGRFASAVKQGAVGALQGTASEVIGGKDITSAASMRRIMLDSVFGAGGDIAGNVAQAAGRPMLRTVQAGLPGGAAATEAQVADLMSKHGYDWAKVPIKDRQELMSSIGEMSSADVTRALSDPNKAKQFYLDAVGKEWGGERVTPGQAWAQPTGGVEQLAREAELRQNFPKTELGQDVQGQKMAGLLDQQLAQRGGGDIGTAGTALTTQAQEIGRKAKLAETDAWDNLRTNFPKASLYNGKTGDLQTDLVKGFKGNYPTSASSPDAFALFNEAWKLPGKYFTATGARSSVPLRDAMDLRGRIQTAIEAARKTVGSSPLADTELAHLNTLQGSVDSYIERAIARKAGKDPALTAAVQDALGASKKVAGYAPAASVGPAGKVINKLINDPTLQPREAFDLVANHPDKAAILAQLRSAGAPDEMFQHMAGGMFNKHLLEGKGGSVTSLSIDKLSQRLKSLADDPMAKELLTADQLGSLQRGVQLAEAMAKRGAAPEASTSLLRSLGEQIAPLARVLTGGRVSGRLLAGGSSLLGAAGAGLAASHMGAPWPAALGIAGGSAAIPFALDKLAERAGRREAGAALNPASIIPSGPRSQQPGAIGAAMAPVVGPSIVEGGRAPPPGLLNSPLAIENNGMGGLIGP